MYYNVWITWWPVMNCYMPVTMVHDMTHLVSNGYWWGWRIVSEWHTIKRKSSYFTSQFIVCYNLEITNVSEWPCICWHHLTSRWFSILNSSPLGQNGRQFSDDIFRCISVNEKVFILIQTSLKFVPKCPIDNKPALFQIMAWRRIGDKPLFEPMLYRFTDAYMRH